MQTLETVSSEIAPLARHFVDAGFRIYLVGGAVRDLLVERREAVDFDLTTDAMPDQTKHIVQPLAEAVWTQGERFGTIGCIINGRDYEITTHRGEFYASSSRKPRVRFTTDLEADLSRRDFTINSMAVSLPDLNLVDPFEGRADLDAKVLRTPLSPQISFTDDPLRMLRAARFVSGYGLVPVPEVVASMREFAPRLAIVSAERIRDEILKLLDLNDPTPGLRLLGDTGVLAQILPEAVAQSEWESVLSMTSQATGAVVRLAVLLADVPPDVAAARMRALRATNDETALVRKLVSSRQSFLRDKWGSRDIRALYLVGGEDMDAILDYWAALASGDSGLLQSREAFLAAASSLRESESLSDFTPPLDGEQIMDLLGLAPGRRIGEALTMLRREHISHGPLSASQAEVLLRQWHSTSESDE